MSKSNQRGPTYTGKSCERRKRLKHVRAKPTELDRLETELVAGLALIQKYSELCGLTLPDVFVDHLEADFSVFTKPDKDNEPKIRQAIEVFRQIAGSCGLHLPTVLVDDARFQEFLDERRFHFGMPSRCQVRNR